MFWATLALAASGGQGWAWVAFVWVWLLRGVLVQSIDQMLRIAAPLTIWLVPVRDLMSVATMLSSYASNRVAWRGQEHRVTSFTDAVLQPGKG